MTAAIATPINHIKLAPGSAMIISGLTWKTYEALLQDLGDNRSTRIAYDQGVLEIRMPGEPHEIVNRLLAKIITVLAMELGMEANDFGSTTLNRETVDRGIEPDTCFYIQNEAAVRGKNRIDLETDPPPDLAIEIDLTSRTQFNNYEALGVPELWRYNGRNLQISVLQHGKYIQSDRSLQFPNFPITELIPQYLHQSKSAGRNVAMKAFRSWVKAQI
ncbi:MAG: Uma2 family endonuclease [Microcoleus sp. T3-bin5]|nr:Uma2 family endonuclease [Microcoleus sp. T3-bin5]